MDVVAGEGGDDLVRVHVRARAGAGLEDVDRELVVELSGRDPVAGGSDALREVGVEEAEVGVRARRSRLDATEPVRHGDGNRLAGDREVRDRLRRLAAPELPPLVRRAHGPIVPTSIPASAAAGPVGGSVPDTVCVKSSVRAVSNGDVPWWQ